ncbi:MAG TPA: riboflavin synthase [Verrucomicrobiae bacterium]|jgi:riboflavin synthase|nr:riboflavin synthase [Verrucomicrobiae bacterium]
MFSGLIGYDATVISCDALPQGGARLRVRAQGMGDERPQVKDSIAIDGVCLTVTAIDGDAIAFDVIPETLDRSTLGTLRAGAVANLEYSLRVGDRMGGHFVYGHVDAAGQVLAKTPEGQGIRLRIERPKNLAAMLVEKAFVAVDGVSVTIAAAGDGWFDLALIPETLSRTTLGRREVGDRVNLEVDPLARYVAAALASKSAP